MEALQPPPFALALLVALLLCGGNVMNLIIIRMAANGTIRRQALAGYRTGATLASDAAWISGHRSALPLNRVGAVAGMLLATGSALAARSVALYLVLLALAVLVTIAHIVAAFVIAHRTAKKHRAAGETGGPGA